MPRIIITVTEAEKDALLFLAERERRHPRDQAALIIRQELEKPGLLKRRVIAPTLTDVACEGGSEDHSFISSGAQEPAVSPAGFVEKTNTDDQHEGCPYELLQ